MTANQTRLTKLDSMVDGGDEAFLLENLATDDPVQTRCMLAMIRIVARRGYPHATPQAIADVAGVTQTDFCRRFASLEGCFVHAYELSHFALVQAMRLAQQSLPATATWATRVEAVTDCMLDFFERSPDSTIALLGEIEHAGAVARLAHLQALRHLARLNRRLYELRRASDPTQPTLPLEVFELGTHGISRLVLQAARTRQLAQIRQLRPAILHVYHGLFACGRESVRPPPVEQLLA